MESRDLRRTIAFLVPVALLGTIASVARGDEITVDGTVLRGTIFAVRASGVDIEPELGKGTLTIAFEDIEAMRSEGAFLVLHGEDGEASGQLLGVDNGQLLVGDAGAEPHWIAVETIFLGYEINGALSRIERLRSQWRYWEASLDAGFSLSDGTTDTTNATVGFHSERRKPGTRFVFATRYLFGTEKQRGAPESTLNNEVHGLLKGEYDLTERLLLLSSFDAEYDEIERLSYRLVPKLGLGYRIYKSETAFFQVESAPAYVLERFFGGDKNDFFGISFGAETGVKLPYSAALTGRVDYLPAIDDWANDYLIRSELAVTMPIVGMLNFRAALADQYDSTPATGNDRNELQTTVGLSLVF